MISIASVLSTVVLSCGPGASAANIEVANTDCATGVKVGRVVLKHFAEPRITVGGERWRLMRDDRRADRRVLKYGHRDQRVLLTYPVKGIRPN